MHELTKLTEKWVIRHGNLIVHTEGYSNIGQWESEVLLPWLKEWQISIVRKYQNNHFHCWDLEKRKKQAEWLKLNLYDTSSNSLNKIAEEMMKKIDQAFGIEEKSLEEKIRAMIWDGNNEIPIMPIENYPNLKSKIDKIIQTIKSHYGIEG